MYAKYARTLRAFCFALAAVCAAPAYALLPIQHWQTQAGGQVYFVQTRDLPMLDVSVDFPAGSAFDPPQKSGLASLTQRLLRLGAGGLSENEIAQRIADTGARVGGHFDEDKAGITLRTLTSPDELKQAVDIFARMIQSPEFSAPILEREKARTIATIKESDTKPESILTDNFNRIIYGNHPYALRGSGEPTTVAAVTREDLLAFYRRYYTADQAIVAIVGDLDRAQAEALAEQLTARLAPSQVPPVIPPVPDLTRSETRAIVHPALQSHVFVGAPGISRDDPDYFPLYVGNYILGGGGFVSRIMDEVRSKRGLAYSAYSYFSPLEQRGPFIIGLQTRKDQAGAALSVVRSTLKQFLDAGPTQDELAKAKQNIIGGFPLRIDSNRKILDYLSTIGFYKLPLTYLDDFVPNVEKVTVADIRRAFALHLNADHLAIVIVGADEATAKSLN